ncbi:hypothetical protein NUW54_g12459 [Trametes sanguinea]|uniref:Uncharacterized protein n=1 Tax=Trametes sanguinea TaxID=158606 RepID=A0ACC1MXU9_9APHY|nr:hypothetical protein NUW54_g12459 [Trametes sanguinea]
MLCLTFASFLTACALAVSALAGPIPPALPVVSLDAAPTPVVDAVVPPLPSIAFTLGKSAEHGPPPYLRARRLTTSTGPRPASDPLPLPTHTNAGGFVPPEMDWLS